MHFLQLSKNQVAIFLPQEGYIQGRIKALVFGAQTCPGGPLTKCGLSKTMT